MAKVLNELRNALAKRNKKLIVRGFFRTPMEHDFLIAALDSVPLDVGVFSKHVPNDFRYNYAPNPLLGKFPNRVQICEVEPARIGAAEYYKNLYQSMRDLGMDGIIPRIRIDINTFRNFNNFCYNKLIHNPDADLDPVWEEFFLPYYGNQIAFDTAKSILNRTFQLFMESNYPGGYNLAYNKRFATIAKSDSRVEAGGPSLWTDDPIVQEIHELIKVGDERIIDSSLTQEIHAEQKAVSCLNSLEVAKENFELSKYNELFAVYEEFRVYARSQQVWAPAYLYYRYWRDHQSDSTAYENVRTALEYLLIFISKEKSTEGLKEFADEMVDAISFTWRSKESGWNIFDGNSLPERTIPPWKEMDKTGGLTDNGFSDLFSVVSDPDISGNKLIKVEELNGDRKESFGFNWGIKDPNVGVTAVFRAKPSDQILTLQTDDGNDYRYIYFSMRNGEYREQLTVEYPGKIKMGQSNLESDFSEYNKWHIYRFTLKKDSFAVYIDENPNAVIYGRTPKIDNDNFFKWGDTSTPGFSGSLLDWLVWDISGAYVPGEGSAFPESLTGIDEISDIEKKSELQPNDFELLQNYPNPFNPNTEIEFNVPVSSNVNISIFDINGRLIQELVNKHFGLGKHKVFWNGKSNSGQSVASGVYFYVMKSNSFISFKKMSLIK